MTLMSVAPMVVLILLAMKHMFASRTTNLAIIALSLIAFLGSFALIRTQTTIGDRASLRSMLPHHSGAILMCREADLRAGPIKRLFDQIIDSQRRELDDTKAMINHND